MLRVIYGFDLFKSDKIKLYKKKKIGLVSIKVIGIVRVCCQISGVGGRGVVEGMKSSGLVAAKLSDRRRLRRDALDPA